MTHGQSPVVRSGYGTPTEAEYALALVGRVKVLAGLGSVLPCRVTPSQRAALEVAQAAGYLITNTGRENEALENAFSIWCFMHRRPFPIARVRGKYAYVVVDFVESPRNLQPTEATQAEANRFLDSFTDKPGWPRHARVSVGIGSAFWSVRPVPVAFADEMLRGLATIAAGGVE